MLYQTRPTKHVKRIYMRVGSADCVRQGQYAFLFGTRLTKSPYINTLSFRYFTAIRFCQEKGISQCRVEILPLNFKTPQLGWRIDAEEELND